MKFYALYSKSQQSYNTPFLAHDDNEAIAIISKTVVSQQDPALVMCLDDLILEVVGEFVPALPAPVVEIEPVEVLDNLDETLPLPPMIRGQVDKIYKRKDNSNE